MRNDDIERRLLKEMDELTLMLSGFEKTSDDYMDISGKLHDISYTLESYIGYKRLKSLEEEREAGYEAGKEAAEKIKKAIDDEQFVVVYTDPETRKIGLYRALFNRSNLEKVVGYENDGEIVSSKKMNFITKPRG